MYDSDAFDSHGQFNVISKWSGQADAGKMLSQTDPTETDCGCRPCVFFLTMGLKGTYYVPLYKL